MRRPVLTLFWFILIVTLPVIGLHGSVLKAPGIADGEQIIWQVRRAGETTTPSTITWRIGERDGKPVYEITTISGENKLAKYVIDKTNMRLIEAQVARNNEKGKSKVSITIDDKHQYLTSIEKNRKAKEKTIKFPRDGYNGVTLPFVLRGFPFGVKEKIKLNLTPPFKPGMPSWAWRMWKSYAKFLGTETVTVPAGTFDCYKLEVGASGGLIKRVTSKYYFWYSKEPPYQFVRYQDKDAKAVTELIEIKSNDKEL